MSSRRDQGRHAGPDPAASEADETLRLLARMPAPEGLAERVQRRLDAEAVRGSEGQRSLWSLWMPGRKLQFAAAAALAAAVAVSMWTVYHGPHRAGNGGSGNAAHTQQAAPAPGKTPAQSGFTPAGAVGVPHSLKPIHVAPAPKRKPGAASGKPSPKKVASAATTP